MVKRHSTWLVNYVGILALVSSFIIGSLVLMNVGVLVYKNIVENNAENFRLRASLSYVAAKVRQYDSNECIKVEQVDGVPVIYMYQTIGDTPFRTMIYCYEGSMRELFQEDGLEYKLSDGQAVTELDSLNIKVEGNRLNLIASEAGQEQELCLYLHSTQ